MFPRSKRSAVLILALAIFVGLASKAGSQPPNDAIPSLATLKIIDYTRTTEDKQSDAMGHSALRDFVNECQAY
ncbi:MAG: hypothetical protein WAN12_06625 [Candidatus Acidiferrum sp.]